MVSFNPNIVSICHRIGNGHVFVEFMKTVCMVPSSGSWAVSRCDTVEATRGWYGTILSCCFAHALPCAKQNL